MNILVIVMMHILTIPSFTTVQDAACSVSPWKAYVRTSCENDIEVKSSSEQVQEPSLHLTQMLGKEPSAELSQVPGTNIKEIPTVGRTQRFLREKMEPRSDTQSSVSDPKAPWGIVDCVFCNFPWGENIFEYYNETENILTNLGKELRSGCECAFITKRPLLIDDLLKRGFIVTKEIPIRDDSRKGRKSSSSSNSNSKSRSHGRESNAAYGNDEKDNTGDCFVTFAVVA